MKNSKGFHAYKRIFAGLLLLTMLIGVAMPALSESYGTVRNPNGGNCVNVRKWASFDAPVIASIPVGAQVQIARVEGAWYCVWTGNTAGYIHSGFVSTGNNGWGQNEQTATISVGPVNLRETPSTRANVLAQLESGATVTVLSPGDTWTQVRVGGVYGYVFTNALRFGKGNPAPAPQPPVVSTQNANATIRTNNGGNLNLRQDANTDAPVIASFANKTRVRVLTHGATWCKVQVGNLVGYMTTRFLAFDGQKSGSANVTGTGKSILGYVKNPNPGSSLNLRKEPSAESKSLGKYKNGTQISILGVGTDWLRVSVDGKIGYMMTKYVSLSTNASPDKTVVNKGGYVNLRAGAGYDQAVLKQVPHGAAATVVIPYATWSRVIVKDGNGYLAGYMLNSFLK